MKAIALTPGTTQLRLADWPEPKIQQEDEIKAKILRVGICGTDREEAVGGRADAPQGEKELIIGHEMLGRVVEVGKSVKTIQPGDLIVFSVRRGCGFCSSCQMDRSDMCLTGKYTERGIKGAHGFQMQYVVDRECYAVKAPSSIENIAVLAEPTSVVEKAIEEAGMIQTTRLPYMKNPKEWLKGKVILVAGLGPIGLLAALIFRLREATVLGLDIVPASSLRAQILQEIGGTYINDKETDKGKFSQKYPSLDLILDAAGIPKLDFDLLEPLSINGIFVLTGVPGDQRLINIDGSSLMKRLVLKNQVILGSVNESLEHFRKGLADLEAASKKWPGVVEKMLTNKIPYTQFSTAFSQHRSEEIKATIEWA